VSRGPGFASDTFASPPAEREPLLTRRPLRSEGGLRSQNGMGAGVYLPAEIDLFS